MKDRPAMRPRDLDRFTTGAYDLLVIGGGVYGLAIAYEGSSRGLRTALVEAADFGSGASFNHQKTAHGGLRSLQTGRVDRALESIRQRRTLARIAPWLLRPLPFLVGTYRSWTRNRVALRAAFRLDAWLGRRRNDRVEPELHLPMPRLLSKAATLRLFPGIKADGLTGGAQWYDYQMVEADRLTFALAEAADRSGADLANYVAAVSAVRTGGRISGMEVRDTLTGRAFAIAARATINAAGGQASGVMAMFGDTRDLPMLKAMNLVTTVPARDIALAAPSSSGRMLTLVPWHGRALIGTSQSDLVPRFTSTAVTASEVAAFAAEANTAFPALHLTPQQVSLVHRGIVPASIDRRGRAQLLSGSDLIEHPAGGAYTVLGSKYTTARGVAERSIDRIARQAGLRARPSRTSQRVLPGAAIADHEALAIEAGRSVQVELSPATLEHLTRRYAERAADIVRLMSERQAWMEPVAPGCRMCGAEVVHALRHEMALRLSDIVIRRSGLGAGGHPGREAVAACARLAAVELGWNQQTMEREIAEVDAFYAIEPS
jgi:glycerol-3-phosphate dehydrogenase